jgi:hypothetical protein
VVLGRELIGRRLQGWKLSYRRESEDDSAALAPGPDKQAKGEAAKGCRRHGVRDVESFSVAGAWDVRGKREGEAGGLRLEPRRLLSSPGVPTCQNNDKHTTIFASRDRFLLQHSSLGASPDISGAPAFKQLI